jgi:hypothetical protein
LHRDRLALRRDDPALLPDDPALQRHDRALHRNDPVCTVTIWLCTASELVLRSDESGCATQNYRVRGVGVSETLWVGTAFGP